MAALREAGVIRVRRDGRWMHYRLDHDVLDAIAALLGQNIAYRAWENPEEQGVAGSHPTIGRRRLPTASERPPLGHPSTGRWTASPGRVTLTLARPTDSGPCEGATEKRQGSHALLDIHLNISVDLQPHKEGMSLCSSHSRA